MFKKFLMAAGLAACLIAPTGASAQQVTNCYERNGFMEELENLGEVKTLQMIDGNGFLIEVFANLETKTWTLTYTKPDKPYICLLSGGEEFDIVGPKTPGKPS
jgi:hypothetical protein